MEDLSSLEAGSEQEGFSGNGYIRLEEGMSTGFELNLPSSQHYLIDIRALAASDNAVIVLTANNAQQGAYYINSDEFANYVLQGMYLDAGVNRLSLTALQGSAIIDELIVSDFEFSEARFAVSRLPANENASIPVRLLMDYFGEIFGRRVLLAQHVTPGTNTEIGAIFEATGRLPAIRVSDLMSYSRSFPGVAPERDDIELAIEWAESGGLVSYDWTWYSPSVNGGRSHFYAGASDINLNAAFTSTLIADLDADRLEALEQAGAISRTCYELVLEIDHMAENLKRLQEENIVVLWRPLHQAGTKWFWWGDCEPESYRWLWRLMFTRLGEYHGLNNLIWVWSGQDAEYYPGDEFVDIIGECIYNMDNISNLPRFIGTTDYSGRRKMAAMTECGLLPSPDLLGRDRAMWLWTALYRGDFLIDQRGRLNEVYNRQDRLHRAYNHELTITLDKLPEEY
jgi:mannan endo-1,4-beta-mannosidase